MHSFRRFARLVLCAGLASAWLLAGTASADTNTPTPAAAKAMAQSAGFAGENTCLTCHEDKAQYKGTPHGRGADARSPAAAGGCETCHGPGQAHVDGGGDKTKITSFASMSPRDVSAKCTSCHNRAAHLNWAGSAHDSRSVSCVTCHSVHAPKSDKAQLVKASQVETCVQCHRDKVQKLRRSAHMPVVEGKMECGSCHNPHGSTNVKLLKAGNSVNESCVSCHTEKRGPYLFDHGAVETNCTSCHEPHGSNNERMLVAKMPFLCQRCHVTSRHPPTVYENYVLRTSTNSNKIFGRSCTVCHQQVHGSNSPSGRAFLR
ncbi:MAG: DmsE family decaheme c-type cytochrome [Acidobacteria bacterium]|nr:DmsE family decaheme c-type cytochrome [Acidobacteriota bacterium]